MVIGVGPLIDFAATRINAFRSAVVSTISATLPDLKSCEQQFGRFDVDALSKTSFKTPCVRFAVLSASFDVAANETQDTPLTCAAFAITDGRDRDQRAWAIAEAIAVLLTPKQLFGINRMSAPSGVKITPVISSSTRDRGVAIIGVEWKQTLRGLGQSIFDNQGHLPAKLYINDELVEQDDV